MHPGAGMMNENNEQMRSRDEPNMHNNSNTNNNDVAGNNGIDNNRAQRSGQD